MSLHEKIKQALASCCKGKTEVVSSFGRIDIVTNTEIIEICSIHGYKECIGRILTFHADPVYKKLRMRLHVFCKGDDTLSKFEEKISEISKVCKSYNIFLTFQINRSFYAYHEKEIKQEDDQKLPILPSI